MKFQGHHMKGSELRQNRYQVGVNGVGMGWYTDKRMELWKLGHPSAHERPPLIFRGKHGLRPMIIQGQNRLSGFHP